jgi:hypothetical protein
MSISQIRHLPLGLLPLITLLIGLGQRAYGQG